MKAAKTLSCVLTLLCACAGDEGASTDGDTMGGTEGGTSSTTGESSESGSGEGSGGGSTDEGTQLVTLSGKVTDYSNPVMRAPIAGAELSLWETPGFETVSDDEGNYEIPGLMPESEVFVLVAGNDTYLGSVRPVMLDATDTDAVELSQIPFSFIENQEGLLADQMPAAFDLDQSILLVRLLQNTATGAVVEVEPAPAPGTFYAPSGDGSPVLDQNTVEFSLLPVVVFFNVTPGDLGDYSVTVTHPERECTVLHPEFPTLPTYITLIDVDCPPPM